MTNGRSINEHDAVRELLPLAAAGALDAAEEARLSAHIRLCADCAANLSRWQEIQAGLRRLPTPQAPAALVERTIVLAQTRITEESNNRAQHKIVGLVIVFSWAFVVISWPLAQLLAHGWISMFGFGFARGWENFAVFTALCWLAGGAAAVLLAMRRSRERRLA
jgi:anti-sigma factor RsiW